MKHMPVNKTALFWVLACYFGFMAFMVLAAPAHAGQPGNNGGGNGSCGQGQQTNGCGSQTAPGGSGTGLGVGVGLGVGLGGQGGEGGHGGIGLGMGGKGGQGGNADAAGGAGGDGGTATGHAGDIGISGDSGHTFVAPAPVMTIAPQSSGGIVTKSHAVGLFWNAVSWSKSEQMTDLFVGAERLVADYERLCQFETAAMIRQRQYALLDPAYRELPAQPGVRNLTPAECGALRR